MQTQNIKLKLEFSELKEKLMNCLTKMKSKPQVNKVKMAKTEEELLKEEEVRITAQKIECYKKQIEITKNQLETSFNIEKFDP